MIGPLVAAAALMAMFARPPWTALRIAGLVIAIASLILLTVARVQLGNSFSVMPEARELVTRGLYSRIRNPIYVFSAIGLAALCLYVNMPVLLLGLLVLVPIQYFRARAEGRVLETRFGEEYRQYKAATWF